MENKSHNPNFLEHAKESLGSEFPKDTIKFKTFVMLFFQDSLQNTNKEIAHLKGMQKFFMKSMRKLLLLNNEQVIEHFKDMPQLKEAYEDYLKEMGANHE